MGKRKHSANSASDSRTEGQGQKRAKGVSKVPAVGVDELEDEIGMIQDSANHASYVSAMKNGWRIAKEEGFHRTRLLGIHLRK
jgi:hypothetical protein